MIVSGSFLDGVASEEFAPFFDRAEYESVHEFARRFPFAVHAHVLELRLRSERSYPDYQVCLKDDMETVGSVRRHLTSANLASPRVEQFLNRWSEPGSSLRARLPLLWLEFDRPEGRFSRAPGIFVAPDEGCSRASQLAAVNTAFDLLYPPLEASRHQRHLAEVDSALPDVGRVKHVGALPARQPDFMRLVIEGVHSEAHLSSLLTRIGWNGELGFVSDILHTLSSKAGVVPSLIDLDFFENIGPNLGLELLLRGEHAPADGGAALLKLLERLQWCTPEKRRVLDGWRQWSISESPRLDPWALWYKLYHIKLTIKPSQRSHSVECKAYWAAWSGPKPQLMRELEDALTTSYGR